MPLPHCIVSSRKALAALGQFLLLTSLAACGAGGGTASDAASAGATAVSGDASSATPVSGSAPASGTSSTSDSAAGTPSASTPVSSTPTASTPTSSDPASTTPASGDPSSSTPVAALQTCFYENYSYAGAVFCSADLQGDIAAPVVGLVSAVKVPAGYKVVLYQGKQFTGGMLELPADAPNLNDLGFNNLAASFKLVQTGTVSPAKQILFIGNSFFHGHFEPTLHYNAANVTDLNGSGYGGVPGIFKQLTVEAGLNYAASIEAVSSQTLEYHYENKLAQIGSKAWDVVVMADQSTIDSGNPARLIKYSQLLEQYVHGGANVHANAAAKVYLMETWARADSLYDSPGGHWDGQTAEQMTADLRAGYAQAAAQDSAIAGVVPVGDAFLRAITDGLADRNPYDGLDTGKVDVWNTDNHHASAWGSYLEACVIFGRVTGIDPKTLGPNSVAAQGLGLTTVEATAAQTVAAEQLAATAQ